MTVYIAVIGVGGVGREVLAQLQGLGPGFELLLLANSTAVARAGADYAAIPWSEAAARLAAAARAEDRAPWLSGDGRPADHHLAFLETAPGPVILIDNTADDAVAAGYPLVLRSGRIQIATPNKRGFSSHLRLWQQITDGARASGALVRYEATVGAGLPVISTLQDLLATGDQIVAVEGVFSGTLSYIFNTWARSATASFAHVVRDARDKGFTEPDPRDDLNGLDVARKLTILARTMGLKVEHPQSFPVQSLVPKALESATASADEFLDRLSEFDDQMAIIRAQAGSKVVRYVGAIDVLNGRLSVDLRTYDPAHPFASLSGSDNVFAFTTKRYPSPLIIQGAGAGAAVTAMGVVSDVLRIAQALRPAV